MTRRPLALAVIIITAALIGSIGLRLLDKSATVSSLPIDQSDVEPATNGSAPGREQRQSDLSVQEPSPPKGRAPGLHTELEALDEHARNNVLWLAIRDARFDCSEVTDSRSIGDQAWIWRADCDGALAYWISLDELGEVSVEPALYRDDVAPVITTPELQPRQDTQIRE